MRATLLVGLVLGFGLSAVIIPDAIHFYACLLKDQPEATCVAASRSHRPGYHPR